MSLDLHIITPEPVIKHGTGVYVRENGQTLELKTMEEVRAHFPDKDLSHMSLIMKMKTSGMETLLITWGRWPERCL